MMKKRLKIFIIVACLVVLSTVIVGITAYQNNTRQLQVQRKQQQEKEKQMEEKKMSEQANKDVQIAFLKAHENELIKGGFEVDGSMTAKNIQFDWKSVEVEKSGLFTAEPYALSIEVSSVDIKTGEKYQNKMIVDTGSTSKPSKVDVIGFSNGGN